MIKLKSYKDESALDVCMRGYNHVEGLVKYCQDNVVAVDFEEPAGVERLIDEALLAELQRSRPLFNTKPEPPTRSLASYSSECALDTCIRAYGHVEGLVKYCQDNAIVIDHEEVTGVERLIDDATKKALQSSKPLYNSKPVAQVEKVIINRGQNIIDLALQETGSIEGLVALLAQNGFDMSTTPVAGTELKVMNASVVNKNVRDYYKSLNYYVNTGEDEEGPRRLLQNGYFRLLEDGSFRLLE